MKSADGVSAGALELTNVPIYKRRDYKEATENRRGDERRIRATRSLLLLSVERLAVDACTVRAHQV
jgi:hypothetical protein